MMNEDELFELVRTAVIWAKADVIAIAPSQITPATVLAEQPVYIDSLEFVAMITHLEDVFGLLAEDDHFPTSSIRTVRDLVAGVQVWITAEEAG